jgi:hypothetical protein
MFGIGKKNKTQCVRLTEKEIRELEKNMTRKKRKEFRKRIRQAQNDQMWDSLMELEFLDEDLFE